MIINGPDEWPGALMVEDRGKRIVLKAGPQHLNQRKAISKTLLSEDFSYPRSQKIVYRHVVCILPLFLFSFRRTKRVLTLL